MTVAQPEKRRSSRRSGTADRIARGLVQAGFLLLFLYPFLPVLNNRFTSRTVPNLTSWLLPWDPLLFLGHLLHRNWSLLVWGAPLLIIALTYVFGRIFCGWICPMGTLLDSVRGVWDALLRLAGRSRKRVPAHSAGGLFPATANSPAKYLLLIAALVGSLISLQVLGLLDPLVIFHRVASAVTTDLFALDDPLLRLYLTASAVFLAIVVAELWYPRFWCRHLCPLGAVLNLVGRRSLLNRKVSQACNNCGACRRSCPMQAIPKEGHDTNYGDCHFCLSCEAACPQGAISFRVGSLAGKRWQPEGAGKLRLNGRYVRQADRPAPAALSRRAVVAGFAAGATGMALTPLLQAASAEPVIRPPGALPEPEFLRRCILCQECVRVCPAGGLRPTVWHAGAAGVGTPQVMGRLGGCLLNPSCPNLCAQVCPVGAIQPIPQEEMRIGRAQVDRHACLAWDQGVKCLVCVEACPTGAAKPFNGRVTVDPLLCSGCGRCEHACPVANSAIHVRPLAS